MPATWWPCAMAHDVLFWYDDRMRSFKLYLKGRQRPTSFPRTVWASLFLHRRFDVAGGVWVASDGHSPVCRCTRYRGRAKRAEIIASLPLRGIPCFSGARCRTRGAYAAPRGRQQLQRNGRERQVFCAEQCRNHARRAGDSVSTSPGTSRDLAPHPAIAG